MADRAGAAASVENRDEALFITSLNLPENQRRESFSSEEDELSVTSEEPELQSLQESVGELQKDVRRKEDEREERERLKDSFSQKNELQKDVSWTEDEINELFEERLEDSFTQKNELPEELSSTEDEIRKLEEGLGDSFTQKNELQEDEIDELEWSIPLRGMAAPIQYGPSGSTKGPYVEPYNCTKIGDVSLPNQTDAEQAAKDYCLKNPAQNCCTIKDGVVTKWSLPSWFDTVELRRAATGVYFLCHVDLDVKW